MTRYYIHYAIYLLLLSGILIFILPCFGQTGGYMFRCAIRDKAGNLWFANTGKCVYRYNPVSGAVTNFTKEDGLNDNNVESIYEDKAGNIWFGTEHGVCRYDGHSFTDMTAKEGLCKFDVNCILEDRTGNFWFGMNGYGVCRYNPASGVVTNFTKEQGLGSDAVQCILEDKAGNLWFGERAGGVSRFDTASGRFTKVNGEGCFSNQVMDIKEDKAGNIWFANLYNGVCRYDGKSFTHFTEENGLCNDTITCIYEDKMGNLWFGIEKSKWGAGRGGVCRYDPGKNGADGKSFTHFSIKEGTGNAGAWAITEDNDGNIWVGSRSGLFRYHSPSGRFIDYTHKFNDSN
jgi:ligand-binding sensor domain-containing protein